MIVEALEAEHVGSDGTAAMVGSKAIHPKPLETIITVPSDFF